MRKMFTALRRLSLRTKVFASIAALSVIVPAVAFAWGPSRATFTEQSPAPYVTFDSITNNSFYGDERQFVTMKDAADTGSTWSTNLTAQPGHQYVVRMFVHNNAASNLNLVAQNVKASAAISSATGTSVPITGYISSSNANPNQVWSDASLTSSQAFNVAYVPGTASWHNNSVGSSAQGAALPDSIVGAGALLGYDKLDGNIPGCYQYSGFVYFTVQPQFTQTQTTDFTMTKEVSKHGANNWVKSYTAQPGETVDYLLQYKNTGTTNQTNVVMKDQLPAGMTYVPGSAVLGNPTNPNGVKTDDGVTSSQGINIGDYAPGDNAWVIFSATAASNDTLTTCGNNVLHNVAEVDIAEGYKQDSADVNVNKTCNTTTEQVCNLSTNQIEMINTSDFDSSKYSTDLTKCQEQVCNLSTNQIEMINTSDFDSSKYSTDLTQCQATPTPTPTPTPSTEKVCDLATKQIMTINTSDFDSKKYPTNASVCVTTLPETGISSNGWFTFGGIGLITAGLGYTLTSSRIRKLFIG